MIVTSGQYSLSSNLTTHSAKFASRPLLLPTYTVVSILYRTRRLVSIASSDCSYVVRAYSTDAEITPVFPLVFQRAVALSRAHDDDLIAPQSSAFLPNCNVWYEQMRFSTPEAKSVALSKYLSRILVVYVDYHYLPCDPRLDTVQVAASVPTLPYYIHRVWSCGAEHPGKCIQPTNLS